MQEMVSCCVAVSNNPSPFKIGSPKKPSVYERKPRSFRHARSKQTCYGRPGKTRW